jgi:hypothetical protein
MRRLLLIVVAVLGLGACASTPQATPMQGASGASIVGFGTLADFGSWEFELAPAYTEVEVINHKAKSLLAKHAIDASTAEQIRDLTRSARLLLDKSRRGNKTAPTNEQRLLLLEARFKLSEARNILETTK